MEALAQSMIGGHLGRPAVVISNRPDARGLFRAVAMNIPTYVVDHTAYADRESFEAELDRVLTLARPDIICLAGFMRVLTPAFVARWQGKILNIHPSLLPKYRGLHTHARVLEAGDAEHGATVHLVTGELDDGPILGRAFMRVRPDDTPDSLAQRLLPLEHKLYTEVLRRFARGGREIVEIRERL